MKSIEWIEKAKAATGIESDYKIAQVLGMTRGGLSQHRVGKVLTLDDEAAFKVEELLNLPHGKVMMDQHAERAKTPAVKAAWQKLAAITWQILAIAVFSGALFSKPVEAKEISFNSNAYPFIHYAQLWARVRRAIRRSLATLEKAVMWRCSQWISLNF
jgi:hypothetical protein